MSININLKNDEDINFWEIGVSGELDVSTADEFKEYLHKLIDEEIRNIRLNLETLDYIDSTGLGVIIGILKRIKVEDKEIYIKSPKDNVKKIFSITGLETIKMELASKPQNVSIVRLTTSGIANKVGFCLDDIEDMKVAVSEACTNAIKHSSDNKFSVEYTIFEDGLTIKIVDSGKGYDVDAVDKPNLKEPKESGLGLFIIQSLMDEVDIKSDIDNGTIIKMTKYLGVDN